MALRVLTTGRQAVAFGQLLGCTDRWRELSTVHHAWFSKFLGRAYLALLGELRVAELSWLGLVEVCVELAGLGKHGVEAVLGHRQTTASVFDQIWRLSAHKEIVRLYRI